MIPTRCGGTAAPSVGGETGAGSGRARAGTVDQQPGPGAGWKVGTRVDRLGDRAARPRRPHPPPTRPPLSAARPFAFDELDDPDPASASAWFSVR
jgi:hypothetical protein